MADAAGALFDSLLPIMARLRGDGGCPWDREQTRESLKPYLIEEAYEVLDAIDSGATGRALAEELGDLLFQVVFHSQIASERWRIHDADVSHGSATKWSGATRTCSPARPWPTRARRWPNGSASRATRARPAGSLARRWTGVPHTLPALLRAQRLQAKAARLGFDWPTGRARGRRCARRWPSWRSVAAGDAGRIREELGDLLFSVVNVARLLGMDAEDALRRAAKKFTRRFMEVEAEMRAEGATVRRRIRGGAGPSWEA